MEESARVGQSGADASNTTEIEGFIRRRCAELRLSLQDLVRAAGISRSHLYKIFDGSISDPSVRTLARLASALRLPAPMLCRYFSDPGPVHDSPRTSRARGLQQSGDEVLFLADLTVPDHSVMMPGEAFQKIWALQNTGRHPWVGRRLVRVDDDLFVARLIHGRVERLLDAHLTSFGREIAVPDTAPSGSCELSMDFRAPTETCSVASIWRMVDAQGRPCFPPQFFLQVVVTVIGA